MASAHAAPLIQYSDIIYEVRDPVAIIWFNRPARANSIGGSLLRELKHAVGRAEADPRVVGIVLTGRGKMFCPGADLNILEGTDDAQSGNFNAQLEDRGAPGQTWAVPDADGAKIGTAYFMTLTKPIVAAINGAAAGFGLAIALTCDMRFCSENVTFTTAFARLGLIAEYGLAYLLPRVCGPSKALRLLWASERVSAKEALDYGFVDKIVPGTRDRVLEEAVAFITQLSKTVSPTSMQVMKRQVYEGLQTPLGTSMKVMEQEMKSSLARSDFKTGVLAFVKRREPSFQRLSSKL